jgi:hypothetical protein
MACKVVGHRNTAIQAPKIFNNAKKMICTKKLSGSELLGSSEIIDDLMVYISITSSLVLRFWFRFLGYADNHPRHAGRAERLDGRFSQSSATTHMFVSNALLVAMQMENGGRQREHDRSNMLD